VNNSELSTMPVSTLRVLLRAAEQAKATAVADITAIQGEINRRLESEAAGLFLKADKTSGDITFENADGKFKASIGKKVEWDSDQLQCIARELPWNQAELLFDIDFSVSEAKYKALTDPALKAKLDDARTVKYGTLVIKPVE